MSRQSFAIHSPASSWRRSVSTILHGTRTPYRIDLAEIGDASVRNIFRASDGSFWIGTDGSGAYHLRDGKTTHLPLPGELTNHSIRAFLETRSGEIWIATDGGVNRIRARGTEKLTEVNGLAYFSTRSLLEDREGTIWIGTDHGLSCWIDGHFVKDAVTSALSQEKIWSILQDRNGVLWFPVRVDHGLFRYSNGRIVSNSRNRNRAYRRTAFMGYCRTGMGFFGSQVPIRSLRFLKQRWMPQRSADSHPY